MADTFTSRRRAILDALQADMMQRPNAPTPTLPAFNATLPEGLTPYTRWMNQRPPSMGMGMSNPQTPMGGGLAQLGNTSQAPGWGQLPIPQSSSSPDMPAPNASTAGPVPMPPQRPYMPAPAAPPPPMPPQRPEGVGFNNPFALIRGYNPQGFAGDPQAVANQYTEGDLVRLAARTYRNEDGSIWNDYYVK